MVKTYLLHDLGVLEMLPAVNRDALTARLLTWAHLTSRLPYYDKGGTSLTEDIHLGEHLPVVRTRTHPSCPVNWI